MGSRREIILRYLPAPSVTRWMAITPLVHYRVIDKIRGHPRPSRGPSRAARSSTTCRSPTGAEIPLSLRALQAGGRGINAARKSTGSKRTSEIAHQLATTNAKPDTISGRMTAEFKTMETEIKAMEAEMRTQITKSIAAARDVAMPSPAPVQTKPAPVPKPAPPPPPRRRP